MRYRLNYKIVSNGVRGGKPGFTQVQHEWRNLKHELIRTWTLKRVKCFTELGEEMENSPSRAVDKNLSQHVAVE